MRDVALGAGAGVVAVLMHGLLDRWQELALIALCLALLVGCVAIPVRGEAPGVTLRERARALLVPKRKEK